MGWFFDLANIGHKIKELRLSSGLTREHFATAMEEKPSKIQDVESGRQRVNDEFLRKLIARFPVDLNWLFDHQGFIGGPGAAQIEPPDYTRPLAGDFTADGQEFALVRRFDLDVSAGPGLVALDGGAADRLALSRQWLLKRGLSPDLCALVRVKGDSMEPTIPDGALVLINAADRQIPKPGIYAFNLEGHSYVKRIAPSSADASGRATSLVLVSDNSVYPPRHLTGADLDTFRIVGRVRAAFIDL